MSRLTKAAEFLFGNNLNKDEKVTPLVDWSPNNVKTLMLSGTLIGVEFFVPCNIGSGLSKYNYGKLGDIDEDIDVLNRGKDVRSVLRVLQGYKPCNNVEEIIICKEDYDKGLFAIDTDTGHITSNKLEDVFPRLYAITVVEGKTVDVFALLSNTQRSEHITDVLCADERFRTNVLYVHKEDWFERFILQSDLYNMDCDKPKASDAPSKYALYTYFVNNGGIAKSEAQVGFDYLQEVSVWHGALKQKEDIVCQYAFDVEEAVICTANKQATPVTKLNALTGLCKNLYGTIEDYLQGMYHCNTIHISRNGMLYINGNAIKPMVGYEILSRLPYEYQYILFGKEPTFFQQDMQKRFGRVLVIDADRNEFIKYCKELAVQWGHFMYFGDLSKFSQLTKLSIDCPHLLKRIKYSLGITEWSDLYHKIPSLVGDGIYINGVHISNNSEKDFYDNVESKIDNCIAVQTDMLKQLELPLPYVPVTLNNTGVVGSVTKGLTNISCKISSIFHRLGNDDS